MQQSAGDGHLDGAGNPNAARAPGVVQSRWRGRDVTVTGGRLEDAGAVGAPAAPGVGGKPAYHGERRICCLARQAANREPGLSFSLNTSAPRLPDRLRSSRRISGGREAVS